jgi:predicted XRE-type DNA-binding protein
MSNRIEVEEGSGNVFADIGLPNPEERLAQADLAIRIGQAICARRLTQSRAAHTWGLINPKFHTFCELSYPVSPPNDLCIS